MQVIPAIDLRDGACVQLVGGSYADERVRIADPVGVAAGWANAGFKRIHVVDLDAATGRGTNRKTVRQLLAANGVTMQCGGGVRDLDSIDDLLVAGASEVVLGTKAIEDRGWLEKAAAHYPNRLIVAADAKGRNVATRGWSETSSLDVATFVKDLNRLPLAAILVTAIEGEGQMKGPDIGLMRELASVSRLPLQASGGVGTLDDLRDLAAAGVSATIVGMALYTGALQASAIIEEFPA
ncbi:MAG: 1-(5-phosphoribosyl)-5-((5-phosphoribosylamino)methylideneamino)imidazole-4-carboxamide isomerase [Gemmatimonadetes bacterium]|jgi:phosphoribosylformimino-5-aminoimidazole carboxamide ribotide isomerase|nr:1-(5-phosphoribosyl)-5-((5-phosphoribosylamino)methylideneamino)imidazole-4-carboxamide isomerase [Gemmatimonadota bacterium]